MTTRSDPELRVRQGPQQSRACCPGPAETHCDHELAVEDPAEGWAEEDEKAKEKEERPAGIKSETCGNGMKNENHCTCNN